MGVAMLWKWLGLLKKASCNTNCVQNIILYSLIISSSDPVPRFLTRLLNCVSWHGESYYCPATIICYSRIKPYFDVPNVCRHTVQSLSWLVSSPESAYLLHLHWAMFFSGHTDPAIILLLPQRTKISIIFPLFSADKHIHTNWGMTPIMRIPHLTFPFISLASCLLCHLYTTSSVPYVQCTYEVWEKMVCGSCFHVLLHHPMFTSKHSSLHSISWWVCYNRESPMYTHNGTMPT